MENTIKTLSLLKVTLDHHTDIKDYLDIFIPFTTALIKKREISDLKNIEKICREFKLEYGLNIPHHPMVSIINKIVVLGYGIEVSKGRIVTVFDKINSEDFQNFSSQQEDKFDRLINAYKNFSFKKHGISLTEEEASNHFISLLEDHDLEIVFASDRQKSILPKNEKTIVGTNLAYDFIRTLYEDDTSTFQLFADIAFGHVIASSLLFSSDIPRKKGQIKTNFYLDTGILFGLFGINGEYEKQVYENFIRLIKLNNGNVFIFNHSYEEFINIIDSCKYWIDNPNYDPNVASRTLVRFKSLGYHKTNIDIQISKIPRKLDNFNILRVDTPDPNIDNAHQISDLDFQKALIEHYKQNNPYFDEEDKEETIYLDVKSVSAIYKKRKGVFPRNINECKDLFVTRNATLAYASRLFEKSINKIERFYIPTTVTDGFIGTMMWLNSPIETDLQNLSNKKLIANCYAALKPTKQQRKLFLAEVEKAEKDKLLSPEEIIVLKTSNVAEELLQEKTLGDLKKITNQTPMEIITEIKARERNRARKEFENKEKVYKEKDKNSKMKLIKNEEIIETQKEIIKNKSIKQRMIIEKIEKKSRKKASIYSWLSFGFLILFFGFFQLVSSGLLDLRISLVFIKWGKIISGITGFLNFLININITNIKEKIYKYIYEKELKSFGLSD